MSRRQNAKYKLDRRVGENVWGRPKSPINKREYGPGQHGQRRDPAQGVDKAEARAVAGWAAPTAANLQVQGAPLGWPESPDDLGVRDGSLYSPSTRMVQGFGQFEPLDLDAFERFLEQELPIDTD